MRADDAIDILMITYERPDYTQLALSRLLETCDDTARVWIWHNGQHAPTLDVVRSFLNHPRIYRFHHSPLNKELHDPTNWLWQNARGGFLSKIDDDCLMPDGWIETLRQLHLDCPQCGIVGCWRFQDEDFIPEVARKKIKDLPGGHSILLNCWIEGSGYLMKRRCLEETGVLKAGQSFTRYCIALARRGWVNGWYYPFIWQEHMDDPRSPHSYLKSDADLIQHLPLSARTNGVKTLAAWEAQLRRSARLVQEASADPRMYLGWRRALLLMRRRVKRLFGIRGKW